jgi:hypothetical protein
MSCDIASYFLLVWIWIWSVLVGSGELFLLLGIMWDPRGLKLERGIQRPNVFFRYFFLLSIFEDEQKTAILCEWNSGNHLIALFYFYNTWNLWESIALCVVVVVTRIWFLWLGSVPLVKVYGRRLGLEKAGIWNRSQSQQFKVVNGINFYICYHWLLAVIFKIDYQNAFCILGEPSHAGIRLNSNVVM